MTNRTYRAELRLRKIDDFFSAPDVSPMSDDYQVYSSTSGIEFIARELAGHRQLRAIDVTLLLPAAQLQPDLESRTRAAVQRYGASRIADIEHDVDVLRDQVRQTLLLAIPAWFVLLGLAEAVSHIDAPVLDIAGQGLGVAAWVLLWFPLDTMIFGIRHKRDAGDVYRRLMTMTLTILPAT